MVIKNCVVFLILIIALMSSSALAFPHGKNNPEILADMHNNSSNYIASGGVGMGLNYYVVRDSIRVDKYDPPEYIIAFRVVYNKIPENYAGYENDNQLTRYKYDYSSRKIYRELMNREGTESRWRYIDVNGINDTTMGASSKAGLLNFIAQGEIAFYLAYNTSFFDKPVTSAFKEYIER